MAKTEHTQINFADCYVLTAKRTKAFITSFLDTFVPNRQEVSKQYTIPQFAEKPDLIFYAADSLTVYLERNQTEQHAIYWLNNEISTLRGALCIFTSDGQVILGVYCETLRPDVRIERQYLEQLLSFCESTKGLIEYEQPAPQGTAEFMERLRHECLKKALKC